MIRQGTLFVVAAPSGGGKTSLVKALLAELDTIEVSVSHTTREKRPSEDDGVNYFFVDEPQFKSMIREGAFIEHANVFGHFYGTAKREIEQRLRAGIDVLLDIDWQGAEQISCLFEHVTKIFIIPPSLEVLRHRLEQRGQDDLAVINERMSKAQAEMSHVEDFDFLIVNEQFDIALNELKAIITSARLMTWRQTLFHATLLSNLTKTK